MVVSLNSRLESNKEEEREEEEGYEPSNLRGQGRLLVPPEPYTRTVGHQPALQASNPEP